MRKRGTCWCSAGVRIAWPNVLKHISFICTLGVSAALLAAAFCLVAEVAIAEVVEKKMDRGGSQITAVEGN